MPSFSHQLALFNLIFKRFSGGIVVEYPGHVLAEPNFFVDEPAAINVPCAANDGNGDGNSCQPRQQMNQAVESSEIVSTPSQKEGW